MQAKQSPCLQGEGNRQTGKTVKSISRVVNARLYNKAEKEDNHNVSEQLSIIIGH